MFDHLGLKVRHLDTSARFYQATLTTLGCEAGSRDATSANFGALALSEDKKAGGPGLHLAFTAPTREAVQRFYRAGLEAGGRDNGKPGLRKDYGPSYYAAFLIDPDGNNVEAVCLRPES